MNNENNSVTITIPQNLLQSIYHVASNLENVQHLLSWLIHLLEGQGVDACPHADYEPPIESSGDCMDVPNDLIALAEEESLLETEREEFKTNYFKYLDALKEGEL
ncbi:MAG: hypothetical protein LBR74_02905 [Eubacterium sp.]|nr:hypothetical protein [Eubacterium sp.]